jgi:hypothetical protein
MPSSASNKRPGLADTPTTPGVPYAVVLPAYFVLSLAEGIVAKGLRVFYAPVGRKSSTPGCRVWHRDHTTSAGARGASPASTKVALDQHQLARSVDVRAIRTMVHSLSTAHPPPTRLTLPRHRIPPRVS